MASHLASCCSRHHLVGDRPLIATLRMDVAKSEEHPRPVVGTTRLLGPRATKILAV
jgi:hypothetical protein